MNQPSDNLVEKFDISNWLISYEIEEGLSDMYHSLFQIPFYYQEGEPYAI